MLVEQGQGGKAACRGPELRHSAGVLAPPFLLLRGQREQAGVDCAQVEPRLGVAGRLGVYAGEGEFPHVVEQVVEVGGAQVGIGRGGRRGDGDDVVVSGDDGTAAHFLSHRDVALGGVLRRLP